MPLFSRIAIRLALLHLIVGAFLGASLLAGKAYGFAYWKTLLPHVEIMLYGWVFQLILGVSYWILPRNSSPPFRGNVVFAWLSLLFLNCGVVASFARSTALLPVWMPPLFEVVAFVFYARVVFPRIRPFLASHD